MCFLSFTAIVLAIILHQQSYLLKMTCWFSALKLNTKSIHRIIAYTRMVLIKEKHTSSSNFVRLILTKVVASYE